MTDDRGQDTGSQFVSHLAGDPPTVLACLIRHAVAAHASELGALKDTQTPGAPSLSTFETRESYRHFIADLPPYPKFRNARNRIEIASVEDFDDEAKRRIKIACDLDT